MSFGNYNKEFRFCFSVMGRRWRVFSRRVIRFYLISKGSVDWGRGKNESRDIS